MWPLVLCSVISIAVIGDRLIVFASRITSFPGFLASLKRFLMDRNLVQAKEFLDSRRTPLAGVALAYLDHTNSQKSLRQEVVSREASVQLTHLERRLHWLAIIGSLAPMLGLLGTVAGLVEAFHQIEMLGGQIQPGDLASGIWAALLTTVFGLVIALPTLAVYHVLENRVNAVSLQMQWLVAHLDEWLGSEASLEIEAPNVEEHEETPVEVGVTSGD
jgi:biopolymer transport protein ExbB